jgi:hypothetical protein
MFILVFQSSRALSGDGSDEQEKIVVKAKLRRMDHRFIEIYYLPARFSVHTVEMIFQRTQRHVLMNQNPVISICAEANEVDEIRVAQRAQLEDMGKELAVALLR